MYISSSSEYSRYNEGIDPYDYFSAEGREYRIALIDDEAKVVRASELVTYVERSWDEANKKVIFDTRQKDALSPVPEDGKMISGWYWLNKDVRINKRIFLEGDTYLILGDGCTMDVKGLYVPKGSTLTIYAQSVNGSGKLISSPGDNGAGIGGYSKHDNGNIIIHGGNIEATGHTSCAGIGTNSGRSGGSITIYSGFVSAQGGENGAGIGGGEDCSGGQITIYGGTVHARGGSDGAGIGGGEDGEGGQISSKL